MKRAVFIVILLYTLVGYAYAQEPRFIFDRDSVNNTEASSIDTPKQPILIKKAINDTIASDSLNKIPPAIPAWNIDIRTGERKPIPMDTSFVNYHQATLVDGQGVAVGYLGNWGSPAQSKIFSERGETSQFYFLDAFNYYHKRPDNQRFLDTKTPFSNFTYQSGGGRKTKEERFTAQMSISLNKKLSFGFDVDYAYSRGYYESLSNKQINYDLFASYKTDKYQMHAFVANNNYTNLENGGLKSLTSDFVRDDSKNLPTNIYETWNKLRGRHLYMSHKYSIGYNDSKSDDFIPVASAFFTTNYADQQRTFTSNQTQLLDDSLYNYINRKDGKYSNYWKVGDMEIKPSSVNDRMSYYSFKNTAGISLNEGFKPWVKFGLTAFAELDYRKYSMPRTNYVDKSSQQFLQRAAIVGGILSKKKGEFLKYNLYADLGVLGYNQGEYRLKADISTKFRIANKDIIAKANGYIKNLKPTFWENNLISRYYRWGNNFDNIHRSYVGGELHIPFSKTKLSGGVENLKNYIYYNREKSVSIKDHNEIQIRQHKSNIQVLSLRLDQKLKAGVLHWDNQLVFQTSSNEDVLPLPKLSAYSNVYVQFKVAKVLDVQIGADVHFHTKYYAAGYDPALLQFYNQYEKKIGNFPVATAYANFHLKKTRFFVTMYNVGQKFRDSQYFSTPDYLVNPMIFKFGLSWNFTN